jgi:uncharacterized protein
MSVIEGLFWRDDRVEHIARHSITPDEVEEALFEDRGGLLLRVGPAERNPDESIYRYFGRTVGGRHIMVVLLDIGEGVAMPITAREMSRNERRRFDERHSKRR